MRRRLQVFLLGFLALLPLGAMAHEMSMAELELRERAPGEFAWQWSASGNKAASDVLTLVWPQSCHADPGVLRCGPDGLSGTFTVDGVGKTYSAVVMKVFWLDGQSRVYTITAGQPKVQLYGSADDRRGVVEIANAYVLLGIEHILTGYDHLLFVIAVLFLVGFNRRLVVVLTAFTLAHSLTLALSALGWLTLRPPPVEAAIALSIVLVAGEALHERDTLARRWPALVAFVFGLVHGLGFAGALREIGLPQHHLLWALVTFNVGVEVGQLLVVGAAYLLFLGLSRLPRLVSTRTPALYVIGGVSAYWTIGRIITLLGR